jgi:hypothetical protein
MQPRMPYRIDGVLCKSLGSETLLYWPDGKAIHVLNRTAHAIWELCDGEHTVQEIEARIRDNFQILDPHADVITDIHRTLQTFTEQGLLKEPWEAA